MDTLPIIFFLQLGIQVILATVAIFLYRRVMPGYRPMLLFVIALLIIEVLLSFFELEGKFSKVMYSCHYVVEGLLICWLAQKMGIFRRPYLLPAALTIIVGCWLVERFITGEMDGSLSWSRVVTSVVIALIGIAILTQTLTSTTGSLLRNALFLFSVALVFNYAISAIMELYALTVSNPSMEFMRILYYAGAALSIITNLFYLKAILCAPKRLTYYTR